MLKKTVLMFVAGMGLSSCGLWDDGNSLTARGSTSVAVNDLKAVKLQQLKNALEINDSQLDKTAYEVTLTQNGKSKTYREGQHINLDKSDKVQNFEVVQNLKGTVEGQSHWAKETGKLRAYQQEYSVVAGYARSRVTSSDPSELSAGADDMEFGVKGMPTQTLPKAGSYTYKGKAFSETDDGTLTYDVDFDKKTGKGMIDGIDAAGKITLHEGKIGSVSHTDHAFDGKVLSGSGIEADASSEKMGNGKYKLGFFGPNAEEVAGAVFDNRNKEAVGFGGKR